MSVIESKNNPFLLTELTRVQDLSPNSLVKPIESPKSTNNLSSKTNQTAKSANKANNNGNNQSSYKYLSWREKDRRRRFREEWRHMWLVIPHGNFEVQCLVCRKVMTQRKLDTIKRHTVRRHAEILEMNPTERVTLFDKLMLQNENSVANKNSIKDVSSNNDKNIYQIDCQDINNSLNSDGISAASSSSLSPLEHNNSNNPSANIRNLSNGILQKSKLYTKRSKYNKKNVKSLQSELNSNSLLDFSHKNSAYRQKSSPSNKSAISISSYFPIPSPLDKYKDIIYSMSKGSNGSFGNFALDFSSHRQPNQMNGNSPLSAPPILNHHIPAPLLRCPWCHEDFNSSSSPSSSSPLDHLIPTSTSSSSTSHSFSLLLTHIQQFHPEKLSLVLNHSMECPPNSQMPLYPFMCSPDSLQQQSNVLPQTPRSAPFVFNNNNHNSQFSQPPFSFFGNNNLHHHQQQQQQSQQHHQQQYQSHQNLLSLLYYQEMMRRKSSQFHSPNSSNESPVFKAPNNQSCNSLHSSNHQNSTMGSVYSNMHLNINNDNNSNKNNTNHLKHESPPKSAFNSILNGLPDNQKNLYNNRNSNSGNCSSSCSPKRMNFSAESLINDDNCLNPSSAFTCPKKEKQCSPIKSQNDIKKEEFINIEDMDIDEKKSNIENENQNLSPISSANSNMICHALRFGPNQDLLACLKDYVKKKNIRAGFVLSCCGSVKESTIRLAEKGDNKNSHLEIKNYQEHFEIVSLEGSIFNGGSHLHISLSDCNGKVMGGHVAGPLIIHTTVEILLGEMEAIKMIRRPDLMTGFSELTFISVNNNNDNNSINNVDLI